MEFLKRPSSLIPSLPHLRNVVVLLTLFPLLSPTAAGQLTPQRSVLSLVEENDAFVGTDKHYTQGAQFTYLEAEDRLPQFMTNLFESLPAWGFTDSLGRAGLACGQKLYTPSNLDTSAPQPGERPYAGWLYLSMILQRRGDGWWKQPMQESLQLDIGVIGPAALGREAQNFAHDTLGLGDSPKGWNYQLPNEPAFELKYARTLRPRLFTAGAFGGDVLPYAGFTLGTVNTSVRAGSSVRIGWNLADDYGPQILDSLTTAAGGRRRNGNDPLFSLYVHAGLHGRVVGYNAFLDGTVFNESQSIDKETLVGDFTAGIVLSLRYLDGGFTFIQRSTEFAGQAGADSFGSLFVRGRF